MGKHISFSMINPVVNRRNISQIFAIAYFSKLSCVSKLLQCSFFEFYENHLWYSFSWSDSSKWVIQYFSNQCNEKRDCKKVYKKNYYNNGIAYENTVENIKGKVGA